jgi:hypothetical protein
MPRRVDSQCRRARSATRWGARVATAGIICAIALIGVWMIDAQSPMAMAEVPAVRFAVLGDRTGDAVPGIYEGIVVEVARLRPDFVVTVGDQVEGPADPLTLESEWREYDAIVAALPAPLHLTPGNNDIWDAVSQRIYCQHQGSERSFGSFDVPYGEQRLHFVVLDTGRWATAADLPQDQLAWLIEDLGANRDARYTFVLMHVPYWFRGVAAGQPDPLHELFVREGVDAVFTGHFHVYFSGKYDGILYTSVASSGGSMDEGGAVGFHSTWVTVDESGIRIAPIEAGAVRDWQALTAADLRAANALQLRGLRWAAPVLVDRELHVPPTAIALNIDNSMSTHALEDTLRWEIPAGWTVTPQALPVRLGAGRMLSVSFDVACQGRLFPLPLVHARFPYSDRDTIDVATRVWVARQARAARAAGEVVIDGNLSESCWRRPETQLFAGDGSAAATDPTSFYFAYDAQNLYIAVHCTEGRMDSLVAQARGLDGPVHGEDCVGYFLAPPGDTDLVYQIYFNPRGAVFDQRLTRDADGSMQADRDWNGDYEVAGRQGPDFWSIEARIGVAPLGVPALTEGDAWRLTFRRKQKHLDAVADWQVPLDYDPNAYGALLLQP